MRLGDGYDPSGQQWGSAGRAVAPLTPTQRDLYLHHVAHPDSTQHLIGVSCRLGADIRVDAWVKAVENVFAREPLVRTLLIVAGGEVLQAVDDEALPPSLVIADLAAEQDVETPEDFIERDRRRPRDLFRLPLWRCHLVRDRDGEYTASLVAPHIFADGSTFNMLLRRFDAEYRRLLSVAPDAIKTPAASPGMSFLDHAFGFEGTFDTPENLRFWSRKLAGIEPMGLPGAFPATGRVRESRFVAEAEIAALRHLCRERRWPFAALLRAVYAFLVQRFTRADGDIAVLEIVETRPAGFRDAAGCFFQTLPILAQTSASGPGASISDLIASMESNRQEAQPHRDISSLALNRILPTGSLNCFFNFYVFETISLLGQKRALQTYAAHGPDEIHLIPSLVPGGLRLKVDFPAERFPLARFLDRFVHVLRQVAGGSTRLDELDLLLPDEAELVGSAAAPPTGSPMLPVAAIAAQAARRPDAVAVSCEGTELSYGELDRRANQLARHLAARGARHGARVAILLERSPDLVVAMLAVLKTGAAYLPLEPSHPHSRLVATLTDSGVSILLTTRGFTALSVDAGGCAVVDMDTERAAIAAEPAAPIHVETGPADAAYVIYTSGSTGKPKGVVVTHGNLAALLYGTTATFDFSARDVWTMFHSAAFDFSVWEIFGALASGARLVIVPTATAQSPEAFLRLLHEQAVTVLNQTPSAFVALSDWEREAALPLSLRYVIFGGEALRLEALSPWIARHGDSRPTLVNMFGITETTVHVTARRITRRDVEEARGRSLIGLPIPGWTISLRNPDGGATPPGLVGEILVGGAGVARGYLNRPELDAERFVTIAGRTGERFYRSGDLARLLPNGDLEYLGRADSQVKIRGYRIELGEIEAALLDQAGVQQAATVAIDHAGDRRLVAYVVPAAGTPPVEADLRARLAAGLPDYMVPWRILMLPTLPRTANGKLDRRALPEPGDERPGDELGFVPAATPLEAGIAEIWAEVLGIDRVGATDQFFELGGNSLLATQMMLRVRDRFGIALPLHTAFRCTTLSSLAAAVEEARSGADGGARPVGHEPPPERPLGPAPLTFAQERGWFIQQLDPDNVAYHFAATLAFEGHLDIGALSGALSALVRRHEVLRTTFENVEGSPRQRVHAPWTVTLEAETATADEIGARVRAEAARPFDLAALPLVRWRLFRLAPDRHMLVHIEHHLLHDGWSFVVLLRDLFALYRAGAVGETATLPAADWHPSDVALVERRWIDSDDARRQLAFWTARLASVPKVLDLPTDRPRPASESFRGDAVRLRIDDALAARVEAFSRQRGVTPHTTLRAVFEALVHRLTGDEHFLVGSGAANRGAPALESVVGMLLNNLALPADLSGAPDLETLVARVRETAVAALDNQEIPFDHVVRALDPDRSPDRSPLCQVFFSSYDGPAPDFDLGAVRVEPTFGINNGSAKFDLNVIVVALPAASGPARSIEMIWEYRTDLFFRETVERWSAWFLTLLGAALDQPSLPVRTLPLMSDAEREQVLVTWNRTATDYPRDATIHGLFESAARETPDHPALVVEGGAISYAELDRRANAFAGELAARDIGAGSRVGLSLKRSPEMIAAMLGALKRGAVYVPLDPNDPPGRRQLLVEQAELDLVVGEDGWDRRHGPDTARPSPDGAAYIMFTSGSTGAPKGVLVTHRNVVRLVRETNYATLGHDEILLQMAPPTFDASTFEIWGALLNGGSLVLWPDRDIDLGELGRILATHRVTTLWLTASLLRVVVRDSLGALGGLRQLLAGGDVLQPDDIARVRGAHPRLRIINGYGPTEGTTFSCCHTVPPGPVAEGSIPIGRPIANTTAYVLDRDLAPVPVGVAGELLVGGDGVALGYVNAPALTAERFLADPWNPGGRLYRTGDRVRWRANGELEFLGRMDRQVKVRGYRVEPAEVESAIAVLPGIRDAVVSTPEDPGGHRLHAYVVTDGRIDAAGVRAGLASRLPTYMIPTGFTFLDHLPLGPTGKIDRRNLPPPETVPEAADVVRVASSTQTEKRLLGIWEQVLGVDGFGTGESFFDLGGHSLLALKLVHDVNAAFGLDLPVRFVINEPTVARQGAVIDQLRLYAPAQQTAYPLIVPLRREGGRKPFFLVAGGFGGEAELLVYVKLAEHLEHGPIYGLRIRGVDDLVEPGASVEAIAAEQVAEIRKVQPKGPYLIGGSCVGGVVAFEIAQQLRRLGEEIALLVLVDSRYPSWIWYWRYVIATLRSDLASGQFKEKLLARFRGSVERAIERRKFQIGRLYLRRTLGYSPRPFAGEIALIISEKELRRYNPTRVWKTLTPYPLTVHPVPGDHFTHLRQYAAETAAALDKCLAKAEATSVKR